MTVGLVVVSHSAQLARGVVELTAQMAPEVRVVPAGGGPDGALGTDFENVCAALSDADSGSGAVLLYDLGSARMVADLAVESSDDPSMAVVAEAPLVEGAVAASVTAQGGASTSAVAGAAESSSGPAEAPEEETGSHSGAERSTEDDSAAELRERLTLANQVGLHARPAALLARSLTGLQASVAVNLGEQEADAASVLEVMGLGARQGDTVTLRASGPDARQAIERVFDLAKRNFDE